MTVAQDHDDVAAKIAAIQVEHGLEKEEYTNHSTFGPCSWEPFTRPGREADKNAAAYDYAFGVELTEEEVTTLFGIN